MNRKRCFSDSHGFGVNPILQTIIFLIEHECLVAIDFVI